ncbi:hypothetical protein CEXT_350221 [Caerostris extrusa]|uniref:Uncharacterized protein n=1 Tax=Caerostris extrusa TaxID=172846 RepID=A0AAV4Y082_CAEEX|nr:hypothetical protein CEXT_350221 [Caerostris extrusa]
MPVKGMEGVFYFHFFHCVPSTLTGTFIYRMQSRMLAEDRMEPNWRNAFYVRIVISAHKTTLSEGGCKPCLQKLRQLSSEYKFLRRRDRERVYKCSALRDAPSPSRKSILEKFLIYLSFKIFWEVLF